MITKEKNLIKDLTDSNQPFLVINKTFSGAEILKVGQENIFTFSPDEGGVEDLRNIIKDLYNKPISGYYKLFQIISCEKLNDEQANTLLKILEEPPRYLRTVLFSNSLSKVLGTIKSRCRTYIFAPQGNINYDRSLTLRELLDGTFKNFIDRIVELDRAGFTNLLLKGIEEVKENLLNNDDLKFAKILADCAVKIDSTNVNYKLMAESLFVAYRAREQ